MLKVVGLSFPAFVIIGTWCVWKYFYYGDILPNTFYVKVTSATSPVRGASYIIQFYQSYFLLPFLLLFLLYLKSILARAELRVLAVIVLLWTLYVTKIGGDFMEFRLLVPILPFVYILILGSILALQDSRLTFACVVIICLGSVMHAHRFHGRGLEFCSCS